MPFVDGKCPLCGSAIRVPDDQTYCHCSSCGQQVLASAAIAFASGSPSASDPLPQSQYETPATAASGGANVSADPAATPAIQAAAPHSEATSATPFLDKWDKTPMGWAILGVFLPIPTIVFYLAIVLSAAALVNTAPVAYLVVYVVLIIAYLVITGIYALRVYPSLFTDKPKLQSPRVAAYLNMAFGGWLFGAIWCSAITKKRLSNAKVFMVLLVIVMIISVVSGFIQGYYGTPSRGSGSTSTAVTATTNTSNTNAHSYKVTAFAEPNASQWSEATGTASISDSSVSFNASANSKQYSGSGTYYSTEQGMKIYLLDDGNAAAYGVDNGTEFLTIVSDTAVLYYLIIE